MGSTYLCFHGSSPLLTSPHLTSPHITPRHSRRGWRKSIPTLISRLAPSTPVPQPHFHLSPDVPQLWLVLSCHHSLVFGSLFFHTLFFSYSLLSLPLVRTLPACNSSKALLNVRFSDAQVSAFTPPAAIHCIEGFVLLECDGGVCGHHERCLIAWPPARWVRRREREDRKIKKKMKKE